MNPERAAKYRAELSQLIKSEPSKDARREFLTSMKREEEYRDARNITLEQRNRNLSPLFNASISEVAVTPDLSSIQGIPPGSLKRLQAFSAGLENGSLADWIRQSYPEKNIHDLAKEIGIRHTTLRLVFTGLGIQMQKPGEVMRKLWTDAEFRERRVVSSRETMTRNHRDPAFKEKTREAARRNAHALWGDPSFREKHKQVIDEYWSEESNRAAQSERSKELMKDEERKAKIAEGSRRKWATDEEYRAAQTERARVELTQRWNNPAFREIVTQAMRERQIQRLQDPEYRASQIKKLQEGRLRWLEDPEHRAYLAQRTREGLQRLWQDPEYREKMSEGARQRWKTPAFREAWMAGMRRLWSDDDFRKRQAEGASRTWEDETFRERMLAFNKMLWQDDSFRERQAEGSRRSRRDPDMLPRFVVPTIQGTRRDVGYAQSTWEANIARVLVFTNRAYDSHVPFQLAVPDEYQQILALPETTQMSVDFITQNQEGKIIGYEIMANPFKDPIGWAKFELFQAQYPDIDMRPVTSKFYRRMQRRFAKRINADSRLSGWENSEDNIRTNPEKYAA